MTTKPTIILVPGAWHGPESFAHITSLLQKHGYPTLALSLASVGGAEPTTSTEPDVQLIRRAVLHQLDQGANVLLLTHSYAGVPGAEAIHGLGAAARQAEGKTGAVLNHVYCTAFMAPQGASLIDMLQGKDLPWFDNQDSYVYPKDPGEVFYNDIPAAERAPWIQTLRFFSYRCFYSPLKHASWKEIPSMFIHCTRDNAIPLAVQEMMVDAARKEGATIETEAIEAGHSPFLSKPEEVVQAIRKAAGEGDVLKLN